MHIFLHVLCMSNCKIADCMNMFNNIRINIFSSHKMCKYHSNLQKTRHNVCYKWCKREKKTNQRMHILCVGTYILCPSTAEQYALHYQKEMRRKRARLSEMKRKKKRWKVCCCLSCGWILVAGFFIRFHHQMPYAQYHILTLTSFIFSFRFDFQRGSYTTACVNSSRRRAVPVVCVFALHGLCIKSVIGIIRN